MDLTKSQQPKQYESIPNGLLVNAPAKINLSLLIAGKRKDGFHEIETIMSKIAWYDQIKIEHRKQKGIELVCEGSCWAPQDDSNLVIKAARLLEKECNIELSLKLTLIKNIPAGTGLGSASSDCAATLLGINKLCELNLENDKICELAGILGSDIPFFIGKNLAYCTGRGEIITEISVNFPFTCLLLTPDISISTVSVYKNYSHNEQKYSRLSGLIHPNIEKKNVDLIAKMCANMLQQSCYQLNSDLAKLHNDIISLKIERLCLSGSGSALYMLFHNSEIELAYKYQQILNDHIGCKSILVNDSRW